MRRSIGIAATAAVAAAAFVAPGTANAATTSHTTTGTIKVCQHGGPGAIQVYANGPRAERAALLRPGTCVTWKGVKAGYWEIGYDTFVGNCAEEYYQVDRATIHRPGYYRAVRWLPVRTLVEAGATTAIGVYTSSTC